MYMYPALLTVNDTDAIVVIGMAKHVTTTRERWHFTFVLSVIKDGLSIQVAL